MIDVEKLKKVSIRGRVAYCVCLCKEALIEEHISSELLTVALKKIGTFCESDTLDIWEKEISEYMPCVLQDKKNNFNTFENSSNPDALRLKKEYERLPKYIVDMIDNTIEVGLANLYGGTGIYSESSLKCCLDVVQLAINNIFL